MLRQHNLDDVKFAQISEEARLCASEYCPAWNNLNTADPGVTLIELFAWLTEMQRYHLNSIEEASPFFPLIGVTPLGVRAAETEISIAGGFAPRIILAGTPLSAKGVRFETTEDVNCTGDALRIRVVQRETVRTPISLGLADAYPHTRFVADARGQMILDFALTVDGEEWTRTDDFRASKPEDKHYTLNAETGEVTFGDGYRGRLPCGEAIITHLTLTRAAGGNIAPNRISELDGLPVSQPNPAEGGASHETAAEALARARRSHRQAVTAADIERLVSETPGLAVERVRAFTDGEAPKSGKSRVVCIAVKLRDRDLTEDDKAKIIAHAEPYRLVCRDFRIMAPEIVRVGLTLELRAKPHGVGFQEEAEESLRAYFADRYGGFGEKIRLGEFRAFAGNIPEVLEVSRCALRAHGDTRTDADGDISVAPGALAILGEVNIRLTDAMY
jgi:hypothetical protein